MRSWRIISSCLLLTLFAAAAPAQILRGDWVEEAKRNIQEHRTVPLRVIVMDAAGKPVGGVEIHAEMLRHTFAWGLRINPKNTEPEPDVIVHGDAPVYRCFSSASLDGLTAWPQLEPEQGQWESQKLDRAVASLRKQGLTLRWGTVVSADTGRLPPWAPKLADPALAAAIESHVKRVVTTYAGRVDEFDLIADTLDIDLLGERFGDGMTRRMYELAKASVPSARTAAAFSDCLAGERLQVMVQSVTKMLDNFTPLDAVTIDARLDGTVLQKTLSRSLAWVGGLGVPVTVAGFQVGGPTPAAAAINLETALWTLFSEPKVRGITFAGVRGDELADSTAALLDDNGKETPAGQVFDRMVHGLWWSDAHLKSDPLGNARARVFAGVYRVTAQLPDGTSAEITVRLPAGGGERIVLLQPLKSSEK